MPLSSLRPRKRTGATSGLYVDQHRREDSGCGGAEPGVLGRLWAGLPQADRSRARGVGVGVGEKEGNPRSFLAAPWSDHTLSRVGVWT